MDFEEDILFLYDTEAVTKESDDPLIAIKYFSPVDFDTNKKCALSGNLVAMYKALKRLTGGSPSTMTLRSLKFEMMERGNIIIALGQKISASDNCKKQLETLVDIITLKYMSVTLMLERWEKYKVEDDICGVLQQIQSLKKLKVPYDLQMKAILLIEHFSKQLLLYGLCLFYGEKLLFSQLGNDSTLKLWLCQQFADDKNETACTEESIVRHFPVFMHQNALRKLQFRNNIKIRKARSFQKKTQNKTYNNLNTSPNKDDFEDSEDQEITSEEAIKKIVLVAIKVRDVVLLVLADEKNLNLQLFRTWEDSLLQLDEQISTRIPQSSDL